MLLSLKIENFALIDSLELELYPGLNIMTGETGAGKSIILDALDAALGGKVSARALRTGKERGMVEATFAIATTNVLNWLTEQQIEPLEGSLLVCSREITTRSNRTRLNGVVVNKQQIESLREHLVEITAQGQTVLLGRGTMQREWLDNFGGAELWQRRETVAQLFEIKERSRLQLLERQNRDRTRLQQIDILQYQIQELDAANLEDANEISSLENERTRLSHSVDLQQQSYQIYEALYQNDSGFACADLLGKAESILNDMVGVDTSLEDILELVSGALAQVEEAGRQINTYGDNLESDPDRLQTIEDRIRLLKQICRKYGPTLTEAIAYAQKLHQELDSLTNESQSIEELEKIAEADRKALQAACVVLTKLRQTAALQLEQQLIAALQSLAMEKVQFRVAIAAIEPIALGADRITFEFSPNPGEPMQPLNEIASGGEMSRFLLALKTCFAQIDPIGTLVFDEIDVGVSGRVSQAIALQLYQLGRDRQVLCVTHQPIVAAIADRHFHVSKHVVTDAVAVSNGAGAIAERTTVRVQLLASDQRKQELAQIAGGGNVTTEVSKKKGKSKDSAVVFAESLLSQAAELKQQISRTLST
jgi:DNA repair protein RecN (Recombination protein N)